MAEGREDPEWDADEHRQRERHQAELDGRADPVGDDVVDRRSRELYDGPRSPVTKSAGPLDVLLVERLVEPVLGVEARLGRRRQSLLSMTMGRQGRRA